MQKLSIGFMFLFSILLHAQQSNENIAKDKLHDLHGLEKATALEDISLYYHDKNWDSVSFYALKLYDVSQKLNYAEGTIQALNHLGKVHDVKSAFASSKKYYDKALAIKTVQSDYHIDSYEGLGLLYLYSDKLDSANIYFDKAIDLAQQLNYKTRAKKIHLNKAIIANHKSHYQKAIKIFLRDYDFFNENDDKSALFEIYNGVGNAYFQLYDLTKAKLYYNKALLVSKDLDNPIAIGRSYGNLANTYGNMQKFDSSIIYFKKSYVFFKKSGDLDRANLVRINLLNLYALTGENQELLILSAKLEKENLSPENKIILLHSKSRALFNLGKFEASNRTLDEAIEIANRLDSEQSLFKLYTTSIDQYLTANNPDLLEHFRKYDSILNTRFDRDNKEIMAELNAKYEIKEKEAQLANIKLENQQQKSYIYGAIGGLFSLIIITGFIIAFLQQKHKKVALKNEIELTDLQKKMMRLNLSKVNNQIDSHDFKNIMTSVLNEVQEKVPDAYQRLLGLFKITEVALYNDALTDSLNNQITQIESLVNLAQYQLFEELTLEIKNELEADIKIPKLLLKNLVENAIKHGIKGSKSFGVIKVIIKQVDNFYEIAVEDNGKGMPGKIIYGKGISVYRDIFNYFNKRNIAKASLDYYPVANGSLVKIKIPINYQYQ